MSNNFKNFCYYVKKYYKSVLKIFCSEFNQLFFPFIIDRFFGFQKCIIYIVADSANLTKSKKYYSKVPFNEHITLYVT